MKIATWNVNGIRARQSQVLEFIERRKAYRETLSPYYKAIGLEYDFGIKLKQHEPVPERELARKDRLRVVSTDLPDILRYSSATLAGSAIYMDVRPRGPSHGALSDGCPDAR